MLAHAVPRLRLIAIVCAAAVAAACGIGSPATPGARDGPATVAVPPAPDAIRTTLPPIASDAVAAARSSADGHGMTVGIAPAPFSGMDVHSVAFLPDGTGFLATWNGVGCYGAPGGCTGSILRTRDAGRSWSAAYTGSDYIQGLSFPDASHGWALGGSCSPEVPAAGCTSVLLRTNNGGAAWHAVYTRSDALFTKVDFVNGNQGWLGLRGGGLLRTADGGRTWAPVGTPCADTPGLTETGPFSFTDAHSGWVVCAAQGDGATVAKAVFGTGDGGRTWSRLTKGLPSSGGAVDIAFVSTKVGWLCTWPLGGPLWLTRDGGHTWNPVATALNGENVIAIDPVPGAPDDIYVVLGLGQTATVLRSVDGGGTWSNVYPQVGPFLGVGGTTAAVDFVGPGEGYALGLPADPGAVVRTEDGGAHWTPVGRLPAGDTVVDWGFAPGGLGWIIVASASASPALLSTANAGRTWQPVSGAPAGTPTLARRIGANGGVLVVGDTLYATGDGGAHFVRSGTVADAQAIDFPDATHGWAIVQGTVRRSVDGGRSWSDARVLADGAEAVGISFADARHGWLLAEAACAQDGGCARYLWVTADGGTTWTELALGDLDPVTVDFVDAHDGWMTTRSGALYRSTDGGLDWTELG